MSNAHLNLRSIPRRHVSIIAAAFIALAHATIPAIAQQSASFKGLGNLDPRANPPGSMAHGISADGTRVVGFSFKFDSATRLNSGRGFRWTEANGMLDLGVPPFALDATSATAVSNDGSIITGNNGFVVGDYYEVRNGVHWADGAGSSPVPHLMEPAYSINDVTADGSMIIGGTRVPGLPWPVMESMFYYTDTQGLVRLGPLPGRTYSWGEAVSADGSVIIGFGDGADGITSIRWTEASGVEQLAGQPAGYHSQAFGISANGSTIVGGYGAAWEEDAYRWTESEQFVSLGRLPGYPKAYGLDVSANGAFIVGYNWIDIGNEEAFIWTESRGMHALAEVLTNEYNINLNGWDLQRVTGVSDDGNTMCGVGINPDGRREAWVATVPQSWGRLSIDVQSNCPNAGPATVSWTGATPNGRIALLFARNTGSVTIPGGTCTGTQLGLGTNALQIAFTATSDTNGAGSLSGRIPAAACGSFLQLIDITTCNVSNVARIE